MFRYFYVPPNFIVTFALKKDQKKSSCREKKYTCYNVPVNTSVFRYLYVPGYLRMFTGDTENINVHAIAEAKRPATCSDSFLK